MDPISFQRTCAYLMQDDVMFPHLTVREQVRRTPVSCCIEPIIEHQFHPIQIYYCAKLQLKGASEEGVRERVEGLIVDLGLTACADTLIGKAGTLFMT